METSSSWPGLLAIIVIALTMVAVVAYGRGGTPTESIARHAHRREGTSLLVYVDGVDAVAYDAPTPVYSRAVIKPA